MSKVVMGIEDALFYADLKQSVVPFVGGQPTFTRNGIAFAKSIEAHERIHVIDTPRITPDGLLLELSQVNKLTDPFDVTTANWSASNITEDGGVTSLYAGQTAQKLTSTAESGSEGQIFGTLTANPETTYVVVERVDTDIGRLEFFDDTAPGDILQVEWDFSDGSMTIVNSDEGTAESLGAVKVADVGPNGGIVYLFWLTATPSNSGNSRRLLVKPTHGSGGTGSIIIHAAQHVESGLFTSPVDGTRAAEQFEWANSPGPQAWVCYVKFVERSIGLGRIVALEDVVDPRWLISRATATQYGAFIDNNVDAPLQADITLTPVAGDVIELVAILNSDAAQRLVGRKNGGAVVAGSSVALASGLPSAWDSGELAVNSTGTGATKGASIYAVVKFSKHEATHRATDGSDDEGIMAEMAGLYVSPDGKRLVTAEPFTELAVNGTFDSDLSSWTSVVPGSSVITWENLGGADAGSVKLDQGASSDWMGIYQAVTLKANKVYVISGERVLASASPHNHIGVDAGISVAGAPDQADLSFAVNETGLKKKKFTVSTDGTYYIWCNSGGAATRIDNGDNISLKEFGS